MDERNVTAITEIHLLGFQLPQNIRFLSFCGFLMIYCVTICGNLLIITVVSFNKTLHSPMYFFLCHLSVSDILLVADILPSMLHVVLTNITVVSFSGCVAQFCFFGVVDILESLILMVMSYDRYLAICKPLHYTLIMKFQFCWITIIISWGLSLLVVPIYTLTIPALQFCGPNVIDHFYCDLEPFLELSCSDASIVQLEVTSLSAIFAIIPFFIVIVSYVYIIITIFEIPSITGRQKVFATCSSHLTVVCIFYSTQLSVYLVPSRGQSKNIAKYLSLLYTVVTPLMNPVIYSLRNKDLKQCVGKMINNVLLSLSFI